MVLGGKTIQPNSPNSAQDQSSSMASSEISDEDGELSLKVMLPPGEHREPPQLLKLAPRMPEEMNNKM